MIDIYELEKIKRIVNKWYYNNEILTTDELHNMLRQIRNLVK